MCSTEVGYGYERQKFNPSGGTDGRGIWNRL